MKVFLLHLLFWIWLVKTMCFGYPDFLYHVLNFFMCFICIWPESKVINHRYRSAWFWEFYLLQEGLRAQNQSRTCVGVSCRRGFGGPKLVLQSQPLTFRADYYFSGGSTVLRLFRCVTNMRTCLWGSLPFFLTAPEIRCLFYTSCTCTLQPLASDSVFQT